MQTGNRSVLRIAFYALFAFCPMNATEAVKFRFPGLLLRLSASSPPGSSPGQGKGQSESSLGKRGIKCVNDKRKNKRRKTFFLIPRELCEISASNLGFNGLKINTDGAEFRLCGWSAFDFFAVDSSR